MSITEVEIMRNLQRETFASVDDLDARVRDALKPHWQELPPSFTVTQFLNWVYERGWVIVGPDERLHITLPTAQSNGVGHTNGLSNGHGKPYSNGVANGRATPH